MDEIKGITKSEELDNDIKQWEREGLRNIKNLKCNDFIEFQLFEEKIKLLLDEIAYRHSIEYNQLLIQYGLQSKNNWAGYFEILLGIYEKLDEGNEDELQLDFKDNVIYLPTEYKYVFRTIPFNEFRKRLVKHIMERKPRE